MKRIHKRMTITLLSDMCCGTGEGDGINLDTTTAFDEMGLPFIPAKRLKGLLRESAEFLADYHPRYDSQVVTRLFGGPNGESGAIRLDNAVISDYAGIRNDFLRLPDNLRDIINRASEFYDKRRLGKIFICGKTRVYS